MSGVPFIPILSILFCVFLIINLGATTIFRFFIWLIIGLVIYFLYSKAFEIKRGFVRSGTRRSLFIFGIMKHIEMGLSYRSE